MNKPWFVYVVECKDGVLYTGITNDVRRRLQAHNSGNGCRFTRHRAPVKLLYTEKALNRAWALQREFQIKRLPRKKKLSLIGNVPKRELL